MPYWVYENWQAGPHKAVIHEGLCGFCKDGKGLVGEYDPNNAKWHGPYLTLDGARNYSLSLKNVIVRKEHSCVKKNSHIK